MALDKIVLTLKLIRPVTTLYIAYHGRAQKVL